MDTAQIIMAAVAVLAIVIATVMLQPKKAPLLNPAQWQTYKLIEKKLVSPNTAVYRFALPRKDDVLGLPIGQHINVQAFINGKMVSRSYTPVSSDDDKGHFDLLIKSYEQGNISKYMSQLKVGDQLTVKGPRGQMKYTPHLCNKIGMIAGGTGITPMLQIVRAMIKNPLDTTQMSLIYANVNESDILLREELELIAQEHPNRFKLYLSLNNPPQGWTQGVGFVSADMIKKYCPEPASDIKILLCGPPPMLTAMKAHLARLNYERPRTISKLEDQVFGF